MFLFWEVVERLLVPGGRLVAAQLPEDPALAQHALLGGHGGRRTALGRMLLQGRVVGEGQLGGGGGPVPGGLSGVRVGHLGVGGGRLSLIFTDFRSGSGRPKGGRVQGQFRK